MLLESSPNIGGVTADVKIWNRNESFLALMCGVRYWFAFNVERACQSLWGCVTCLSGPMGLYRTYDLDRILGPWSLQTFGGKETTFGDDRHLTNQLLALGLDTKYTHRTFCQSESPTQYVRWIKQQTRWSKSFFREAFWFPKAFAYHRLWLSVETTKQSLYPFILISTILHFLYFPNEGIWQPVIWLATMIGVAFIKSLFAFALTFDFSMLLFSFYGIFYFFGLLPSVSLFSNSFYGCLLTQGPLENLRHAHSHANDLGDVCTILRRDCQIRWLPGTFIPCRASGYLVQRHRSRNLLLFGFPF